MSEDFDWINAGDRRKPTAPRRTPQIDTEVTKILGKPVMANDPRLIRLVVEFKNKSGNSPDSDKMDNFLYNPDFLKKLRATFNAS